jgi:hypothetical protein
VSTPAAVWLDAPPAGWSELLRSDPNATAAHRPEVWRAFTGTLPGLTARFAAVMTNEGLIGGAPAVIERRGGFHWIFSMPMILPGAPLARAGRHGEVDGAVGVALAALRRETRSLGGAWSLYRPRGPAAAPEVLAALPGETRMLESGVIELGGGIEEAWRRVGRKTRQEIQNTGAGLRFGEEAGALDEAYTLHAAQSRRWRTHAPLPLELSRRLLAGGDGGPDLPIARLFTARDGRGLLSAAFALDHGRETLVWWSGTHPEGRAREAFGFLLWSIARWAAAGGRERVNLGASPGLDPVAAFKRSLGAVPVAYPVRWFDASGASAAGRLLALAQRWRRRGRAIGTAA